MKGYDDREFDNVPSRRDCEEMCLRERSFKCRSAEFDTVALTCTLSRETRRTKPKSFREARNIDYLENGCIDSSEYNNNIKRVELREFVHPRLHFLEATYLWFCIVCLF